MHACIHTYTPTCTLSITNSSAVVQVAVSFDKLATNGLELRYPYGFELGCATANGTMSQWMEGTAMKVDGDSVMVELPECPNGEKAATIRYCWRTDPCTFMVSHLQWQSTSPTLHYEP